MLPDRVLSLLVASYTVWVSVIGVVFCTVRGISPLPNPLPFSSKLGTGHGPPNYFPPMPVSLR